MENPTLPAVLLMAIVLLPVWAATYDGDLPRPLVQAWEAIKSPISRLVYRVWQQP
ncbi:hypothetical protein AB0I61_17255 [Polymorphospora rubra]|uniref:hypothetical protein n=1 Tax=Polymorphospora rubra TaxID=338584 RepID=UPI0033FDBD38